MAPIYSVTHVSIKQMTVKIIHVLEERRQGDIEVEN